jgi:hypothetical protein
VIGPRWRRAASLAATSSTPPPAAPPQPEPQPARALDFGPEPDDAFATFHPGGRQPSPPPVPEPVRQEAPTPAPTPAPAPAPVQRAVPRSPGPPSNAPPAIEEGEFQTVFSQTARRSGGQAPPPEPPAAEPPQPPEEIAEAAPDLGIADDAAFMTVAGHGLPAVPAPGEEPVEEEWAEEEYDEEAYDDEAYADEEYEEPEPEPAPEAAPPEPAKPLASRLPEPVQAQKRSFMARMRNLFSRDPESLAKNPGQLMDEPKRMLNQPENLLEQQENRLHQRQYDLAQKPQNLKYRAENLARNPDQLLRNPDQLLQAPGQMLGQGRSLLRSPAFKVGAPILVVAAIAAAAFGLTRGGGGGSSGPTGTDAGKPTGTVPAVALAPYAKSVEHILVVSHGAQSGLDRVIRDVHDSGRSGTSPAMAIKRTRTLVRTRAQALKLVKDLPANAPPELAPAVAHLRQAMTLELAAGNAYLRWMRSLKPGADTYPYNAPAYQRARSLERSAEDVERRFMVRYRTVAKQLKLKTFVPGSF